MAQQRTIVGAHCRVFINGKVLNEVQKIDYAIDYGEESIYGIDSVFPQEIKVTRVSVAGSMSGIRIKNTNGLQGYDIRPQIFETQKAPYISIRVQDLHSGEDILWLPQAKISNERASVAAKGVLQVSFNFIGIQPQQPLDR